MIKNKFIWIIVGLSFFVSVLLALSTQHIAPIPTDSMVSYVPAAQRLSNLDYISQIHTTGTAPISAVNMYLKENLILFISFAQSLLNDPISLYPNIFVLICSFFISCMALFHIFRRIFNCEISFFITLLFLTTAWPYMYILFGAHQIFVLMFFLLAFLSLLLAVDYIGMFFVFGIFLGLMIFSSPTSIMYIPYFLFCFLINNHGFKLLYKAPRKGGIALFLTFISMVGVVMFFTAPDIGAYFNGLNAYKSTVQAANHFQKYYHSLSGIIGEDPFFRGAGWVWIYRYMLLIIPGIFSFYFVCNIYLLVKVRNSKTIAIVLLGCLTPLIVEFFGFAQFGRNYFSWFFGILFVIAYALKLCFAMPSDKFNKKLKVVLLIFLISHAVCNAFIFIGDIYPKRMAVTRAYQWLKSHDIKNVYMYKNHPNTFFTGYMMSYISNAQSFNVYNMEEGRKTGSRVIMLPPSNTEVIWHNCVGSVLSTDYLNVLKNGLILAQFDTILSSPYWTQEEEICAFKSLILRDLDTTATAANSLFIIRY